LINNKKDRHSSGRQRFPPPPNRGMLHPSEYIFSREEYNKKKGCHPPVVWRNLRCDAGAGREPDAFSIPSIPHLHVLLLSTPSLSTRIHSARPRWIKSGSQPKIKLLGLNLSELLLSRRISKIVSCCITPHTHGQMQSPPTPKNIINPLI
jgi:hypothetical protein